MAQQHIKPHIETRHGQALVRTLKDKLKEEAQEVEEAVNFDELIEEMADVLEVLQTLAHQLSVPFQRITQVAESKRKERGGFSHGHYVHWVSMAVDNPNLHYYERKPHLYTPIVHPEKE